MNTAEFTARFLMQPLSNKDQQGSLFYASNKPSPLNPLSNIQAAAVLVLLQQKKHGLQLILTKRAAHLRAHPGQICFPGGKQNATDKNMIATALREAEEEIGLSASQVQIMGQFPVFQTLTGFAITPVIGLTTESFSATTDTNEVSDCFAIPLSFLMQPHHRLNQTFWRDGIKRNICFILWQDKFIWGATAAIIHQLCQQLAIPE